MALHTKPFHASSYLRDEESKQAYLDEALEDGSTKDIVHALHDIFCAEGGEKFLSARLHLPAATLAMSLQNWESLDEQTVRMFADSARAVQHT